MPPDASSIAIVSGRIVLAFKSAEPSLAELAQRRRAEMAAFDANPPDTDDEFCERSGSSFLNTEDAMARADLHSKADAMAAIDVVWEELAPMLECAPLADVMLKALRRYIAER